MGHTSIYFSFSSLEQQLEAAAARASEEEKKRLQTQMELQDRFSLELEREKMVKVHEQQNHWIAYTFFILNWCKLVWGHPVQLLELNQVVLETRKIMAE